MRALATRVAARQSYEALCAERCDGEGTWDADVAAAWAALPLLTRLWIILGPALRDALHELVMLRG